MAQTQPQSDDFYSRFYDQLLESQVWPGVYLFKFIVKAESEHLNTLKSYFDNDEPQFSEKCTLITFPHNRKDVIKSNLTEKALKKFGEPSQDTLIVVGGCFSLESVEKLKKYNAVFLALSEFSWTDERYTLIKAGERR